MPSTRGVPSRNACGLPNGMGKLAFQALAGRTPIRLPFGERSKAVIHGVFFGFDAKSSNEALLQSMKSSQGG